MLGKRPLQKWSGELAFSTERDFERKALPFLRALWPAMVQVPARKDWDSKGVDLAVWSDAGELPVAVQCKGFAVHEIGPDQTRQVLASIDAFDGSNVASKTYIILHNRDGRNREFAELVEARLRELVTRKRVERALLWDRQKLLAEAFERLKHMIASALREYACQLLSSFNERFSLAGDWVPMVPVIEDRLVFHREEPCTIENVRACERRNVSDMLLENANNRWTLLTGAFGAGKTTAVLHAGNADSRDLLLVEARQLPFRELRRSTNLFLEQIVNALNLLGDYEPQDREVLAEVAGPAFHDLLQDTKNPYVLVIDGLDENRAYSTFEGLQTLSNQLSSVRCPVVLTTRREHLNAMFGNFSAAFFEFSTKHSPTRDGRLLTLEPWGKNEVLELMARIGPKVSGSQAPNIGRFCELVESGEAGALYGQLPFHPLFLRFIVDDILERGLNSANRSELLIHWTRRKIRRDVAARGIMLGGFLDIETFVARIIRLTEDVAGAMVEGRDGQLQLVETISSDVVTKLARQYFDVEGDPVPGVLLNSVLMAQGLRRGLVLNVGFAFRVFHEYFLARSLVRNRTDAATYPETVRSFVDELGNETLDL